MIKLYVATLVSLLLILPGSAFAQDTLQNSTIQQQTGGAQATGSLQNDNSGTIQQNSNPNQALQQPQPESLGVVAQPDQAEPSVEVDASATTTSTESNTGNSSTWWIVGLFLLAIVAGFIFVLVSKRKSASIVETPADSNDIPPESPTEISSPTESERKTKAKTAKPKKRKKKKAHR